MTTPIAPPDRILLIKLRHHGDVLLTTPVVNSLKYHFPQAEIDMLVYQETMPMLAHNPDIHCIFGFERQLHGWQKIRHMWKLCCQLRQRRYDWVLHLSDQWNGALLARWLKPKVAVGFDYPKRRNKHWLGCFTHLASIGPAESLHMVEQNLRALETLGLQTDDEYKRCIMAIAQDDRKSIKQKLASLGVHGAYIVVHPPARWFFKCWEDDRFAEVIQALANDGWPVIVTGGNSDQELTLIGNIMSRVQSPRVHSLAGQLTLNTLAALIENARLFVGVDSVPMHMASALQTDCVALFGPSKLHEWRPWMGRAIVISAADYAPLPDPDDIETSTTKRYLAAIPTEAVLDACQRLLRPHNNHKA